MENHNDLKITYDITMLNKDSFIEMIHMSASLRETRAVYKITPQHNSLKTRLTF